MTRSAGVLIVGAGLAGIHCALSLRELGFDGPVRVFGDEPRLPYDRPPLSKDVLLGRCEPEGAPLTEPAILAEARIELLSGRVIARIDAGARRVAESDGRMHDYDALVIATGAGARLLALPGLDPTDERVHVLRDANDALRLRLAFAVHGRRLLIVGGGFIGLEAASCAAAMGLQVTVLEVQPRLLARTCTLRASQTVAALHASRGVRIKLGCRVERVLQTPTSLRVECGDESLGADLLLIGVGSEPRVALAADAGLAIDDGVVCDRQGRTSFEGIFACGDVARWCTPGTRDTRRLESWASAREQGTIVAAAIVGRPASQSGVPWFWSDQCDTNLQMLGTPLAADEHVMRGSTGEGRWIEFALRQGQLVGVTLFNMGALRRAAERAIAGRLRIDREALSDPTIDPKVLLTAAAATT